MLPGMPPDTPRALLGSDFPLPLDLPFRARDAAAAGVSRKVLGRLHRDGLVRRLLKGVYVAGQTPDTLVLRTQALALVVPEEAVVTDWTAAWLYTGLLPPNDHLAVPAVSMHLPAGRGRLRNPLTDSGERTFSRSDLTVVGGFRITTPLRTAWDVGRFSYRDLALGGLDGLSKLPEVPRSELLEGVERFRRQRGVVQLRHLAPLADPRADSMSESVVRLRWLDLPSLPKPEPQVPVLGSDGRPVYWLDLGVPELRFAVEYDGELFHSTPEDRAHDERRRAWIRSRGWTVVVVRKENVFGSTRDIEQILVAGIGRVRRDLERLRPTG
jgi:hypothetical protein